jgi:hypothetical protein
MKSIVNSILTLFKPDENGNYYYGQITMWIAVIVISFKLIGYLFTGSWW